MSDDERRASARRAALALGGPGEPFPTGSLPVFHAGDRVVKLFPPEERAAAEREAEALGWLEGRLPLPTPPLLAVREVEGWTAVVMGRLAGRPLREAWPEVPAGERLALAGALGEALAALHALPIDGLGPLSAEGWAGFVAGQRARCVDRQRQTGLEEAWCERIPAFLDGLPTTPPRAPALLHTEVMREHLLVERAGGRWRLSGLIDFEPSMVGDPEYELASVGLFVSEGEPGFFGAVVEALGGEADEALALRVMGWALLHRYSRLRWYLDRLPGPEVTLEGLAARWFGA